MGRGQAGHRGVLVVSRVEVEHSSAYARVQPLPLNMVEMSVLGQTETNIPVILPTVRVRR